MVFKLEDSPIIIDGRSIFKGLVATYIVLKICGAIYRVERKYYAKLDEEVKKLKEERKMSKKQKVESK